MIFNDIRTIRHHAGHKIECVVFQKSRTVSLECETCKAILIEFPLTEEETQTTKAMQTEQGGN